MGRREEGAKEGKKKKGMRRGTMGKGKGRWRRYGKGREGSSWIF